MRKFYSFVLMACTLLLCTNVWADSSLHANEGEDDVAKVKINGGDWQYTEDLKAAFDAVGAGQTATIELLDNVNLDAAINMPASIPTDGILNVAGQNITLDLGGFTLSADSAITPIRIMKGHLNIEGDGLIKKDGIGRKRNKANTGWDIYGKWEGEALILICGAEDSLTTNWSSLTIGKDVKMSIVDTEVTEGVAICIADHDGLGRLKTGDPLYAELTGSNDAEKFASIANIYGYCTYYYNSAIRSSEPWITTSNISDYMTAANHVPMKCGAPANAKTQAAGQFKGIQQGSAFGVKVFINGTVYGHERAFQIIGHVNQKPECMGDSAKRHPELYPAPYYKYQYPYIKIGATAHLSCASTKGSTCVYGAGYGIFDIEGEVKGATGIYLKAGDVDLKDAVIVSTCETFGTAELSPNANSVNKAGGSAIVVESNDAYAGGMGVSITGDTKVEGNGGYAIFEETTKGDNSSTTSNITITGGTIESGDQGGIAITNETKTVTTVTGGTVDNGTVTITNGTQTYDVSTLTPQNQDYHTTTTKVDGKDVIVITKGAAPSTATAWSDIADNQGSDKSYNWTAIESATIGDGTNDTTVVLNELQIISGSAGNLQELTIMDKAVLEVNQLTLNDFARITVKAGGRLIVKGDQGIVAGVVENIKLENQENKPAIFLFNPAVTSNKHPKATVEFTSKGFNNTATSTFGWQKFGLPTKEWSAIEVENNIATAFSYFDYEAATPAWTICGVIEGSTSSLDSSKIQNPFEYYEMEHNTATVGTKVTFKGSLVGNLVPELLVRNRFWSGFANSYSAPINADTLMNLISSPVDKAFYLYTLNASDQFEWIAVSQLEKYDIQPMQPFLLRNGQNEDGALTINYGKAVYNAVVNGNTNQASPVAPSAPARSNAANNFTKVKMLVNGEGCSDRVIVAEDAQFSAEFDNGYDVVKYMNEGINMYVSAAEKQAHFATDNLENTYVGLQTVNGGNYTIEFANVQGAELTLIDHETSARVAMVEGNKYEFTAAANSVNDYRFEIVSTFKAPTAIENTEAVKSAKGIYTITGQYVGEMSGWNSLPAGVYVIDGAKRVK